MLRFDPEAHVYTWNGERVPNVTSILKPLVSYAGIPAQVLENARQQGVAVHKMVELDCAGALDVAALPEWMGPVYGAWCEFKDASGFVPLMSEQQVYHPAMRYAGTLDLVCELPRLKGWSDYSLIDVKRSLLAGPAIGLQLAAYKGALEADKAMPRIKRRGALSLKDNKFRLQPYDDASDFATFLALLTIKRFKEKHYGYEPDPA